jgi:exopolysaccharide biosynthesis polyprenyl glycosylphosphotransferase
MAMNNPEISIVVLPRKTDSVKSNQPSQIPFKQPKAFLTTKSRISVPTLLAYMFFIDNLSLIGGGLAGILLLDANFTFDEVGLYIAFLAMFLVGFLIRGICSYSYTKTEGRAEQSRAGVAGNLCSFVVAPVTLTLLMGFLLLSGVQLEAAGGSNWEWGMLTGATAAMVVLRSLLWKLDRHWAQTGRYLWRLSVIGLEDEQDRPTIAVSDQFGKVVKSQRSDGPEAIKSFLATFIDEARAQGLDEILIKDGPIVRAHLETLVFRLSILPVRISLALGLPAPFNRSSTRIILVKEPMSDRQRLIKRGLDCSGAGLAILALGLLMAICALAVKIESRGPVLFRQQRYGYNSQLFTAYKFRTMYTDQLDYMADQLTERNDPRVTRVGALLRRLSLDELPQLFNVIMGDMALVGPRPHPPSAKAGGIPYRRAIEDFDRRYRVMPGITGWAQVNGLRGNTDTLDKLVDRFAYDLQYIEHWSIGLDLNILLRTPIEALIGKNAY